MMVSKLGQMYMNWYTCNDTRHVTVMITIEGDTSCRVGLSVDV